MSLRTPLGRVLGKGAAKEGPGHWWTQRVTSLPALDHATVAAWMAGPWTSVLLVVFVLVVTHHSYQGMQVVIEDYVHDKGLKVASLLAVTFAHAVIAAAAVIAVLRVALGSVP